jgi:ribonuclease VapC
VIILDTSALIAIVLDEPEAARCTAAIAVDSDRKISAGTLAEAMIIADGRNAGNGLKVLIERLRAEIVPLTAVRAERVGEVYRQWGKGHHPASLNFGDCFAYALAKELACPLVFIGNDFARTDVIRA